MAIPYEPFSVDDWIDGVTDGPADGIMGISYEGFGIDGTIGTYFGIYSVLTDCYRFT